MAEKIEGLNFWDRPNMVDELEGKIQEIFILSEIPALEESFELVTAELLNLAKRRELDILSSKKAKGDN
jgi:type I restriction enzyme R subunit